MGGLWCAFVAEPGFCHSAGALGQPAAEVSDDAQLLRECVQVPVRPHVRLRPVVSRLALYVSVSPGRVMLSVSVLLVLLLAPCPACCSAEEVNAEEDL